MENNIGKTVYNALAISTAEIGKKVEALAKLEEKMRSGRYSQKTNDEFFFKTVALRREIESDSNTAIEDAKAIVEQYRRDAAKLNNLDPAQLTDDVKLLQSGIILLPRDIQAMLERNNGNRTMTQIILRFAEANDIDVGNTVFMEGKQEEETAKNIDEVLHYYAKWIGKPNAKKMLDKFFHVAQQEGADNDPA